MSVDCLDYTDKGTWQPKNVDKIAAEFHYVPNKNFMSAFQYMVEIAQAAESVVWLETIAAWAFSCWKPPLEKTPSTSSVTTPLEVPPMSAPPQQPADLPIPRTVRQVARIIFRKAHT